MTIDVVWKEKYSISWIHALPYKYEEREDEALIIQRASRETHMFLGVKSVTRWMVDEVGLVSKGYEILMELMVI